MTRQYTDKLVDVTDLANYLGAKYGGWYDTAAPTACTASAGSSIPVGIVGNAIVYRDSRVKAAGFDGIPKDSAGFLKLCQALKAKGTPAGFALGHAVGDGNAWSQLAPVAAGRQARRRAQQRRHQQPRDDRGARVREGALRDVHPGHAVVGRSQQQQGVPAAARSASPRTASRSTMWRSSRRIRS
jgi:hypothetical protein